jgi:chemotaxis protein histidine kinase CheA
MKNKTDFSKGKYTTDSVIGRAYRVHDKWVEKKYSSKKIVESVEEAVADVKKKKTRSACINALVCLFALDLRIKEKYNNFFRCLFSYFSWRRETRALKLLRDALKIPTDEGDIRTAIEVALQRLRETINAQDTEEDDDETHGGKRNARAEEKAAESEEKQQDQVSEEAAENTADAKENKNASEKKSEELAQKAPDDNNAEELAEKQDVKENAQAEQKSSAFDEKQEVKQTVRLSRLWLYLTIIGSIGIFWAYQRGIYRS